MIPKTIHLIWIGDLTADATEAVALHTGLNPHHDVRLHRDDRELLPQYRELYALVKLPQLRADLLRWSLLEQYGGWYFDIDICPRRPVEDAEKELRLDGSLMFLTERGALPNNDIIAVGRDWPHWTRFHDYFREFRTFDNEDGKASVNYSCFSLDAIMEAVVGHDGNDTTRWTVAPKDAYDVTNPRSYGYRAGK